MTALVICAALIVALAAGCAGKSDSRDESGGRPESVTAYQAVQFTKPAADKWESSNWMVDIRQGDPNGLSHDGRAKIWEVYYFSPRPEVNSQLLVDYNRGNVWPQTPGVSRGGDEGVAIYRKEKPPDFRVDSPEAYTVALRNGGGEYMDAHPDTQVGALLRCKADYDAIGQDMPAPKYKWIWEMTFRQSPTTETLHVLVDGMNGDFITKQVTQPLQ